MTHEGRFVTVVAEMLQIALLQFSEVNIPHEATLNFIICARKIILDTKMNFFP